MDAPRKNGQENNPRSASTNMGSVPGAEILCSLFVVVLCRLKFVQNSHEHEISENSSKTQQSELQSSSTVSECDRESAYEIYKKSSVIYQVLL